MTATQDQKLGAADIAALVRREISKGNLQLHDRLPPERVLAETYGAARGTTRGGAACGGGAPAPNAIALGLPPGSGSFTMEMSAIATPSASSMAWTACATPTK